MISINGADNAKVGEQEGLPDHMVRFRNVPLAEEVAKRATQLLA